MIEEKEEGEEEDEKGEVLNFGELLCTSVESSRCRIFFGRLSYYFVIFSSMSYFCKFLLLLWS